MHVLVESAARGDEVGAADLRRLGVVTSHRIRLSEVTGLSGQTLGYVTPGEAASPGEAVRQCITAQQVGVVVWTWLHVAGDT